MSRISGWVGIHKIISALLAFITILVIALVVMSLLPFRVKNVPGPDPSTSYEDAVARYEAIAEGENARPDLIPVCRTKLLTHGEKVQNAIVLYHGFTSCPEQYAELGQQFYDQGYNVLIPLQPHHGEVDRLNPSLGELSSEELAAFGMETVDIAHGLGDFVTVSGISGGGTITTWLAQERDDIDVAMPVSPFLGIGFLPTLVTRPVSHILDDIPNIMQWWDPIKKENNPFTDEFQYPRFGTHALAEYLRLGFAAENDVKNEPPAGRIIMVSNASDPSVSNDVIDQFVGLWKEHISSGAALVESYRFEKELGLPHDIITPARFESNTTVVYPKLMELLGLIDR